MVTILNKTPRPVRIQLPGGKTLHLGPFKSAKVTDQAAELPSFRKHIQSGEIVILGSHGAGRTPEGDTARQPADESTHGHPQPTMVMPKGNR
jgi:hypothetical protein